MTRRVSVLTGLTVLLAVALRVGAGDVAPALAQARTSLARHDGRSAVAVLEAALPDAPAGARAELLAELRRAYSEAIQQSEVDGKPRETADYRENLAILERSPRSATPAESSDPAANPVKPRLPSSAPAVESKPPAPPEALASIENPVINSSPPSMAEPLAHEPLVPIEPPARKDPRVKQAALDPAPEIPADPPASRVELSTGDDAFQAKNYAQAGAVYAALAQQGRLPEVRRDAWAYCRMVAVVQRINERSHGEPDWEAIRAEIEVIRQLNPQNWYAEYLRNLVVELSAKRPRGASDRVVLRGGSPAEETGRSRLRRLVSPSTSPAPKATPAPESTTTPIAGWARAGGTPSTLESPWQVLETANFRIYHTDTALARHAGQVAEATREEQARRWGSSAAGQVWTPRCDLYLYPNATVFHERTGQPAESPGFSTMSLNAGRVASRRVNLRADHPNLLAAVLPHEVTHVVLADLFPDLQIPRWADEGMAVLSEPASEQDLRAGDLAKPLTDQRLFRLSDLMTMDYPDGQYWSLYYAQSVSLTRFLVEQGTPAQFVEFVRSSQRGGIEDELKRVYQIDGFTDLQRRWLDQVRTLPAVLAAIPPTTEPSEAETPTARR